MKREIKQKWIEALESGDYIQSQNKLKRDVSENLDEGKFGYCCLGVLAEVLGYPIDNKADTILSDVEHFESSNYPQLPIDGSHQAELIEMNDSKKFQKTFPEIADWISTNIPEED